MSILYWRRSQAPKDEQVSDEHPLPVEIHERYKTHQPPVGGYGYDRVVPITGIGTGAAYTAGDAFGGLLKLPDLFRPEKGSGWITGLYLLDRDDEGMQVDVPLFTNEITATTDNDAFALSDTDLRSCREVLSITSFYDWGNNRFGKYAGAPVYIVAGGVNLYTQCIVQGAANIAAGAEPLLIVRVVPD